MAKAKPDWDGFYTIRDVSRLAGIALRTLYDWRLREVITPSLSIRTSGKAVDEGYTYADLTIIRLIRALREDRIDFASAEKALRHMYERLGPPDKGWTGEKVYFFGRKIFVEGQDDWPVTDATQMGQTVAISLFGDLFEELRDLEEGASIIIPKRFRPYVQIDPNIMGGEPTVRGTRLPTSVLGSLKKSGTTKAAMVRMYGSIISPVFIRNAVDYEDYLDLQAA